ncbi:MAG TPA: PEP-CTERM sorting domain-containing protein [Telluria sp.]
MPASAVLASVELPAVMLPSVAPAAVVLPTPARPLTSELTFAPVQMPDEMPTAIDDPVNVPEPGTVATLAAGLALMGAVVRRRRPAR